MSEKKMTALESWCTQDWPMGPSISFAICPIIHLSQLDAFAGLPTC